MFWFSFLWLCFRVFGWVVGSSFCDFWLYFRCRLGQLADSLVVFFLLLTLIVWRVKKKDFVYRAVYDFKKQKKRKCAGWRCKVASGFGVSFHRLTCFLGFVCALSLFSVTVIALLDDQCICYFYSVVLVSLLFVLPYYCVSGLFFFCFMHRFPAYWVAVVVVG